jgi:dolichyl-phosphate beta-glucosyltransferase
MNNSSAGRVLLIVPCFNEEKRLRLSEFAKYHDLYFIFVNDCSTDGTGKLLEDFCLEHPRHRVVHCLFNVGKGEAVRVGMTSLKTTEIKQYNWIGFWDADLSTPLWEVNNFLKFSFTYSEEIHAIFGSRVPKLGSSIIRSKMRKFMSIFFKLLVERLFQINFYDSQCGAKLFRAEIISELFRDKLISKWVFDIEILNRLVGKKVIEYPLQEWIDVPGSKLNITRDTLRILSDLLHMRRELKK